VPKSAREEPLADLGQTKVESNFCCCWPVFGSWLGHVSEDGKVCLLREKKTEKKKSKSTLDLINFLRVFVLFSCAKETKKSTNT
jgi:hypothetical protein